MGTIRSFIAFKLPDTIISEISGLQKDIKARGLNIRWVKPENIHLTLKFLGDIAISDQDIIKQAISAAVEGYAGFSIYARGIGVFPGVKRPRVIWTGINGQQEHLIDLQKSIEQGLETIGIKPDNRPYKGHLTIGRAKGRLDPKKIVDVMKEFGGFKTEPFAADRVILFKSDLKPQGAVYTPLAEIGLG